MRGDGDDRDLAFFRTIAPEDTVGARRAVLNVSLEHLGLGIVGVLDRIVFMRIEPRVARVCQQEFNALDHLLEKTFLLRGLRLARLLPVPERLACRRFKLVENARRLFKPDRRKRHQSSSRAASFAAAFKSGGLAATFPLRAWSSPRRTEAKAFGFSYSHASRSGMTRARRTITSSL